VADQSDLRRFILRESGLSSRTLVSVLCPELHDLCEGACSSFGLGSYPLDPSDLHRCVTALKLLCCFEDGKRHVERVAAAYPGWKHVADNWDEWMVLYAEECVGPKWMAPKLYDAMHRAEGRRG